MTGFMKIEPKPSDRESLAGLVERVTYQNAESGFCVVRVRVRGRRELVTLVGHAAAIAAGEWITATGNWVNDRTHGQQFKARFLKTSISARARSYNGFIATLRNLTVPSPNCSANGPSVCRPLRTLAVCLPSNVME